MKRPWMLLPLFVLVLQSSWGQAPWGSIEFPFTPGTMDMPGTAVYDLTGTYPSLDQSIVGTGGTRTPLSIINLELSNERSGQLRGTGTILVAVGTDTVAARYTASGRISGGGNRPTKVQLSVRLSGLGEVAGQGTRFSISVRYNLVVDPDSRAMLGTARGQASFSKLPGGKISTDDMSVNLPLGVDGSWSATLNVLAGNRLGGSADVVLPNGRTLPTRLSGSFVPVSGLSKVHLGGRLEGENDGRGTALRLNYFNNDTLALDSVNGMILGQKVVLQ